MFPDLPTDNLYKFIAIFGLVLYIYGTISGAREIRELVIADDDVSAKALEKAAPLLLQGQEIEERANQLKELGSKQQLTAEQIAEGKEILDEGEKLKMEFAAIQPDLQRVHSDNSITAEYVSLIGGMTKTAMNGGAILMVLGFGLWYLKVQRYQDAILKKEAEDKGVAKKRNTTKRDVK